MRLVPVFLLVCASSQAASDWLRLKSANFELFTTTGERKGKEAILYFEQMRSMFQRFSGSGQAGGRPVRIIAFRNDKEYAPYRPGEVAAAFYQPGNERDYIVMGALSAEFYPVALHEYTHLITQPAKFPIWLNEGIAELYSSTKPIGNKIQIGNIIPGRAMVLNQNKFIPVEMLLGVNHDSALYNEKNRAGMFYAESWLLTHMLHFSPEYRPKAQQFLNEVSGGKDSSEAFRGLYGKSPQQVEKDLQAYHRQDSIFVVNLDMKLEKSTESPDVSAADPFDTQMALAELLSQMHGKEAQAAKAYDEIAVEFPKRPEVEEARAWLSLRGRNRDGAEEHFRKAVRLGSKSAKAHYDLAMLVWSKRDAPDEVVVLLKKALQLDPNLEDGNFQLGMAALNAKDYTTAGEALGKVRKVTPARAFELFQGLARASYEKGDFVEARKSADRAKQYAKTESEITYIGQLMEAIEYKANPRPVAVTPLQTERPRRQEAESGAPPVLKRREPTEGELREVHPQERVYPSVEGALRSVDCSGAQARLQVDAGGRRMAFLIKDPSSVVIRNTGNVTHEFTCGPQKGERVKIEFAAEADAKQGSTGIVKSIEFR